MQRSFLFTSPLSSVRYRRRFSAALLTSSAYAIFHAALPSSDVNRRFIGQQQPTAHLAKDKSKQSEVEL
jgi:hypothetical protein